MLFPYQCAGALDDMIDSETEFLHDDIARSRRAKALELSTAGARKGRELWWKVLALP